MAASLSFPARVKQEKLFGTLCVSTSPHFIGATRATGADFVFIDTEHIALDRNTLSWMCTVS